MISFTSSYLVQIAYLFVVYLKTLFSNTNYTASNERILYKWWTGKDVEHSDRDLILGTIHAYAWKDWRKTRKASVRIAGLRAKIWTVKFTIMKQEC
jgi:hypothetical protein